jgi:general secretion pathway protein I
MLSRALVSPTDKASAGFTLVEALVALAIVAVSVVAIGALMGATARGSRHLEQHVALVQAAYNALWLAFPSRSLPAAGTQSGESNGHLWRADIESFAPDLGAPAGEVVWVPQKVVVRVRSRSGATVDLETVRLFRKRTE